MKAALVLHGEPPSAEDLEQLADCQHIVCADGGAEALLRADIVPHRIVGDMDSLSRDVREWAEALEVVIEKHPARKDFTDGELALEAVLAERPDRLVIVGGHGGRSAHFLANLKLLRRCHEAGVDARMCGRGETLHFLVAGETVELSGAHGHGLSVLPIDGDATVSLWGTAYDVEGLTLTARSARGLSNRITDPEARLAVHDGTVLVVLETAS